MAKRERAEIRPFFDEPTNTVSYLVFDPTSRRGVVIDPVLDYEPGAGTVDTRSVEAILAAAAKDGIAIDWVLETHAHADHLSGASFVKAKTGAKIAIGTIATTRMACPELQREQEDRILSALELAATARVRDDGLLEIRDAEGRGLLRATRADD